MVILGGSNAGHTLVVRGSKYALHLIPCGVIYPHTMNLLGNGVVIHLKTLIQVRWDQRVPILDNNNNARFRDANLDSIVTQEFNSIDKHIPEASERFLKFIFHYSYFHVEVFCFAEFCYPLVHILYLTFTSALMGSKKMKKKQMVLLLEQPSGELVHVIHLKCLVQEFVYVIYLIGILLKRRSGKSWFCFIIH